MTVRVPDSCQPSSRKEGVGGERVGGITLNMKRGNYDVIANSEIRFPASFLVAGSSKNTKNNPNVSAVHT